MVEAYPKIELLEYKFGTDGCVDVTPVIGKEGGNEMDPNDGI